MPKHRTMFTAAALALSLVSADATAQSSGKPATHAATRSSSPQDASPSRATTALAPGRASQLLGAAIVNDTGKTVWKIADLVVDPDGDILAIIDLDDGQRFGIPLVLLKAHLALEGQPGSVDEVGLHLPTAAVERFSMRDIQTRLDSAPRCKGTGSMNSDWLTRTRRHYAIDQAVMDDPAATSTSGTNSTNKTSKTSKTPGDGTAQAVQRQATSVQALLRKNVKTGAGDIIGNIKDVAVDLRAGRVAYAIVASGGMLGIGASFHAVPFDMLALPDGSISDAMTADSLAAHPVLDLDRLAAQPLAVAPASAGRSRAGADVGSGR